MLTLEDLKPGAQLRWVLGDAIVRALSTQGEPIRQIAYYLYTLCERKGWAEHARAYNELIGSWPAVVAAAQDAGQRYEQLDLL